MPAASAQTNKKGQPDAQAKQLTHTEDAQVRTLPDKSKRFALVIGVDKYTADDQINPLVGAGNDARMLAKALTDYAGFPAENVIVLTSDAGAGKQPLRSSIYRALAGLKNLGIGRDGMLLVAFSGHGIEQNGKAFLLPADALSNRDLVEDFAIPVTALKEKIRETNAGQVILILDACRNDPAAGRGDKDEPLTTSFTNELTFRNREVQAFVTLYAASVGQRAWEDKTKKQGFFTMALVEGLRGADGAANAQNGEVTLGSLLRYVEEQVPKRVKMAGISSEQRPYAIVEGYKANELLVSLNPDIAKRAAAEKEKQQLAAAARAAVLSAQPTTGTLSVVAEPKALVTVAPVNGKGANKTMTLGANQRSIPVDSLAPGRYVVTATLDGYETIKTEVEVVAGKSVSADLNLKLVTYNLQVKTNVTRGKIEFGLKGEQSRQITAIQNGQATLGNLRRGEYVINVMPDEVGYSPKSETVSVAENKSLVFNLERPLALQSFEADFTPEQWDVPSNWKVAPRLHMSSEGIGLLRESVAGRYADVELISNVELVNGTGVSFVLRAVDKQNYYLVRLTGPKADVPNKVRVYSVKDGRPQQLGSSISVSAFDLSEQFVFTLKLVGNRFEFTIDDNVGRAELLPVGIIFDPNSTFTSGAVGVAANAGDQAKILRMYLNPKPKQ
ncbi:MAG TPA: caspase family protein [Pyrinomonadaceae bacterium]|jgi:uncharacterized caspase-like protein